MNTRPDAARPFFLAIGAASGARRIFCLYHAPGGASRGAFVYVPPFVEEMNKSRRMAALQSRALAAAGWHILQIDPSGSGDSEGDFADASWAAWLDDVAAARQWLAGASGHEPGLWGLRLGALLAAHSLAQQPAPGAGLLLWQPVLSGRQHLQQFLRVEAGAQWLGAGERDAPAIKPIDRLQSGEAVEVSGYRLTPALALPMAAAELQLPADLARLVCFEVSPRDVATLSPATERLLATAPAGCAVHAAAVQGPSFWQAIEIETAPGLISATIAALV